MKTYLGDGVYGAVDEDTGDLILTTENGVATTNRIVLEGPVLYNLVKWLERFYPEIVHLIKGTV